MDIHSGITQDARQLLAGALSRLLADTYALYLKTQNFHWNVTAHEFFSYHIMFEKQYEELADAIDEIAERIRALGFYVDASFSAFSQLTQLSQDEKLLTAKDMLQTLLKGHEHVIREARKLSEEAEKGRDAGTVDLMGRRLNVHEKMAWMLRSHL